MENRYVHYGLVLGLIAAISAGILGAVNNFTSTVIAENNVKVINEARKQVLPEASTFKSDEIIESNGMQYVPGYNDGGELVGYVASVTAPDGYAGNIDFVLGMNKEAVITGLNIINSGETPGLGARINEPEWQEHWIGKDDSYEFNKATDAFAGATISPTAVYNASMRALKTAKEEVIK